SAEKVLTLSRAQRQRTLIRLDSGGGEQAHVNWLLQRGYAVLVKAPGTARAKKLAQSVTAWTTDPHDDGRQMAFVALGYQYAKPPDEFAVRSQKQKKPWPYAYLFCSPPSTFLPQWAPPPSHPQPPAPDHLLSIVYPYDQRGGGIKTHLKADKPGLAMTARRKR